LDTIFGTVTKEDLTWECLLIWNNSGEEGYLISLHDTLGASVLIYVDDSVIANNQCRAVFSAATQTTIHGSRGIPLFKPFHCGFQEAARVFVSTISYAPTQSALWEAGH
jgi:hypothetical protein